MKLYGSWAAAPSRDARRDVWHKILAIWADQVFTIGIVGGTLQPIVVKNGLRGVPVKGVYAWEPGSHFGIYTPDTFYWEKGHR